MSVINTQVCRVVSSQHVTTFSCASVHGLDSVVSCHAKWNYQLSRARIFPQNWFFRKRLNRQMWNTEIVFKCTYLVDEHFAVSAWSAITCALLEAKTYSIPVLCRNLWTTVTALWNFCFDRVSLKLGIEQPITNWRTFAEGAIKSQPAIQ